MVGMAMMSDVVFVAPALAIRTHDWVDLKALAPSVPLQ
jgi:hypothetical protein